MCSYDQFFFLDDWIKFSCLHARHFLILSISIAPLFPFQMIWKTQVCTVLALSGLAIISTENLSRFGMYSHLES